MKKILLMFSMGIVIIMLSVVLLNKNYEITDVVVDAKTEYFSNMTELEKKSPIIVKGKKVRENRPTIIRDSQGQIVFIYTLSTFEVTEIYKNNTKMNIKNRQRIPIIENEAYDRKTRTNYHIASYLKMQINNEYILFLEYSDYDKWYVPKAVTFGKIPLDPEEPMMYQEPVSFMQSMDARGAMLYEEPVQESIANDVREKYK